VARAGLTRLALAALPATALLALVFAALFLAGDAQGDVSRLGRWSPWLFGGALLAVLVLIGTLLRQLLVLRRERRAGAPGARLTARTALALVLIALPPVLLVYGFALKFLDDTVDSWFNVRVEQALDDALALGQIHLGSETQRAARATQALAAELAPLGPAERQPALDAALDASGALQLALFSGAGAPLASAASDARLLLPVPPDQAELVRALSGAADAHSEPLGDDLVVRVMRGVDANTVLLATYPLSAQVQPLARNIQDSFHAYERLGFLRDALKLTFTLILTAVVLLSALLAVLAAIAVARRQVAPIARLARATREVAAGRYGEALPAGGDDELGFLTESFNRMTRELAEASAHARASQAQTEAQRAYLETVLERLSSGVLTVDGDGTLRTANAAAGAILRVDLDTRVGHALRAVSEADATLAPLVERIESRRREGRRDWREEIRLDREPGTQVLMARAATLPGEASVVVVFDDQTLVNQAQREAAWAEVARRLAHEVKNPLTPIQLAAERLRHRLGGKLGADDAGVLDKSTHTIVAQVEALKGLVNAFGDYAREQPLRLVPVSLNAVVSEVLDLYDHEQTIALARDLDPAQPQVRGDAGRIRQLLHNLLKNAIEAANGTPRVDVATRARSDGIVELAIADRGAGLPPGFDDTWFEPYKTSKPRGTGLGLAVVRKIAEEHGATVRAEPREGGGARFVVAFARA
jgi:nitrogen fixation/metabolism regulation signal transduction histidine kinase